MRQTKRNKQTENFKITICLYILYAATLIHQFQWLEGQFSEQVHESVCGSISALKLILPPLSSSQGIGQIC
jgi:hypothetical protein